MTVPLSVDLVPPAIRRTRAQRRRVRAWGALLSVYGTALGTGALVLGLSAPPPADDRVVQLARMDGTLSELEAEERTLTAEWHDLERARRVAEAVASHPDWSVALALVAEAAGPNVVLTRVALVTARDGGPQSVIRGFATENGEVNGFVIRLEACGLFRSVVLTEARRESLGSSSAFAFQVTADVGPSEVGDAP